MIQTIKFNVNPLMFVDIRHDLFNKAVYSEIKNKIQPVTSEHLSAKAQYSKSQDSVPFNVLSIKFNDLLSQCKQRGEDIELSGTFLTVYGDSKVDTIGKILTFLKGEGPLPVLPPGCNTSLDDNKNAIEGLIKLLYGTD